MSLASETLDNNGSSKNSSKSSSNSNYHSVSNEFHTVMNGNVSTDTLREETTNGVNKKLEEIKKNMLELNKNMENLLNEISKKKNEMSLSTMKELLYNVEKYRDKKQGKDGVLPDKEFQERNSLLTELFEITHIRTIYNLFMVSFIYLALITVVNDFQETGWWYLFGTNTILKAFDKFPICFGIWCVMQISAVGVYVAFKIWSVYRLHLMPKSLPVKLWDYSWLTLFIIYQVLFIIFPTKMILNEDLPIACSGIVLMEQIRFMMKNHAFVRSSVPRFLSYKPHTEVSLPICPGFSQYLYFLFAPTIIYRDKYPRTKQIKWMVIVRNFVEVILVIFYLAFITERFLAPVFSVFGTRSLDREWIVKNVLEASVPGIMFFISGNYLLLHAWLNAWAELLQFADRRFYMDWWNCTSYRNYYRTWNAVVHDWLYTYIYKDMYEHVTPRNKTLAAFAVFFISAIVHEYILAFMFRFFYPVMFVMFGGLGYSLTFVGKVTAAGNVFMWLSFCLGNGIMFSFYAMEYYARINCLPRPSYYWDLFLPRSWDCQPLASFRASG
ncbi:sterol O-acyltransferase 1 isoform X2 [Pseudomyrmex gracilis]|uniref:sterol O-acyltransferase 1 isoform X2 n=1 Tax=Pseudomyrmex gracilis TaxID=219809 RepID=UPI0009951FB1|nr:sterol O-acyltransferase 1 isoform X2 [Pseudomyrmex gracilis]